MAGYVILKDEPEKEIEFHIGWRGVAEKIRIESGYSPVITLQLDGDELDAALWGLEMYRKELTDNRDFKNKDRGLQGLYFFARFTCPLMRILLLKE